MKELFVGLVALFVLVGCHQGEQAGLARSEPTGPVPSPARPADPPQPLRTLQAASDQRISAVAFSPDGRTLATGDFSGGLKLWEVGSGRSKHSLKGHVDSVVALAFTGDGNTLITGSEDRTVKLWEVETGRLKQTLPGNQKVINAVVLSPDGKILATGGGDNKVRLWETANWQMRQVLEGDEDPGALAESPEGMFVSRMAFSPAGKWLAVAHGVFVRGEPSGSADYVTVWDTATWRVKRRLFLGRDFYQVYAVAFAPDNKSLLVGYTRPSADGKVLVWDVTSGERRTLAPYLEYGPIEVRGLGGDKPTALVGGGFQVTLLDLATGKEIETVRTSGYLTSLAVSPDEKVLAVGDQKGTVTLWNLPLR